MDTSVLRRLSRRQRRIAGWLLALTVFYLIAGFLILPPIIRSVAAKQISKQLGREVSIQKIKINPLTFSITIGGLLIKDKDGVPFVSWDEVYANFQVTSLFGRAWTFREINVTKPFVRAQVNKDKTFNFSDLISKFSGSTTNEPTTDAGALPIVHIGKLKITGASASLADFTTSEPFKRNVGPVDLILEDFRTESDHTNSYVFTGTSDAGDQVDAEGYFQLDPIRSQGHISISNIVLNSFAPLYQDILKFNIKDGIAQFRTTYHIGLSETHPIASVTNTSFALRSLKVSEPDSDANLIEQPDFSVNGVSVDTVARHAEINSIASSGARVFVKRDKDATVNVIELAKPNDVSTNAPGGIVFLLHSVTNVVALLMNSTNTWTGIIHEVSSRDGAVRVEDLFNSRPVHLTLDQLTLVARNISNDSGTNFAANFSARWNTNGLIATAASASFQPFTADIHLDVTNLDLHPVDPYLESMADVIVLESRVGMSGNVHLRTPALSLPQVKFQGDAWVDDFATVDGFRGEDLVKWKALHVNGIDADLIPPTIAIKEISLNDASARVVIETNNTINLLAALRMNGTNSPTKTDAAATPETPVPAATGFTPQISIASIVISNTQTRFTDRTFSPSVNMSVEQIGGNISGLTSDQMQHADVDLSAKVDGVGPMEIKGTINPLAANQTTDLKITARNVELTPTSPYVGKYAGYRLAKGKVEADLDYQISDRKIKAANLITLDQFTFGDKVDSPDATHLPVRLAIAILKDRQGKIVLDVPVEGSLDDPKFRLSKVIWGAVLNIITKVATSPFAVLGAAFGGHGDELSFQNFAPGSVEIQPQAKEKLDTIVKALYDRPGLQLEIEGSVDPATDRDGLTLARLETELRTLKWTAQRESEKTTLAADQMTITPDERVKLLTELYHEAFPSTAISSNVVIVAPTNAVPAPTSVPVSRYSARTTSGEKGAELLMRGISRTPEPILEPASTQNVQPATNSQERAASPDVGEMEAALLGNISITDSDFLALATDRAKAVRNYILQGGQVEPDRIFLKEAATGGVKAQGSRVNLELQ